MVQVCLPCAAVCVSRLEVMLHEEWQAFILILFSSRLVVVLHENMRYILVCRIQHYINIIFTVNL